MDLYLDIDQSNENDNNYLGNISEPNITMDEKLVEPIQFPLKFLSFKECIQTENAQITNKKFEEYDSDLESNDNNINGEIRENSGLKMLIINQIETYQTIKPTYYNQPKPKRNLTSPGEPVSNDGKDNKENNLIVFENDEIKGPDNTYKVIDILGQGISGQVFKVQSLTDNNFYALKIIKNREAYKNQSLIELKILTLLKKKEKDKNIHIIKLQDYFFYYKHLCIVFELLTEDLYQFLQHKIMGISLRTIRTISKQILEATQEFHKAKIIHCDLKPENILLKIDKDDSHINGSINIKVTDFGSSCFEGQTLYKYIQSRYYRAPEVIIGIPYNEKIDIWSIGCICAELYLGVPLLQGSCEYEQLKKIIELFGDLPFYMMQNGRNFNKYYKIDKYNKPVLKTHEEYYFENPNDTYQKSTIPYDMFSLNDLCNVKRENDIKKSDNIHLSQSYSSLNNSTKNNLELESFVDFLKTMLQLSPNLRWNANQCLRHPFITKENTLDKSLSLGIDELSQFTYNENLSNSFNQNMYNQYHSMMMGNSYYQYNNNMMNNNRVDVRNSSFGNYYFNGMNNNSFNSNIYQPNLNNVQINWLRNYPFAIVNQFSNPYQKQNERNKMNNTFTTTSFDKINSSAYYGNYLREKTKKKISKKDNIDNKRNIGKKKSIFGQRRNSVKNKNIFGMEDEYINLRGNNNNKSMVVNDNIQICGQHRTRSQSDANGNMFVFNPPNIHDQLNSTFNNSKDFNEK